MIIAYYPGAGGNRYLQKLLNQDWTEPDRSYDNTNIGQLYQHRYLLDQVSRAGIKHVLTHCLNSQKIKQTFPGEPIVFIKSNMQVSLQREWTLHGHERFCEKNKKTVASRLEHYLAIRDQTWPLITTESQLDQLPDNIKQEVLTDYQKINFELDVPGILENLTQQTVAKINSAYEIIKWHLNYYEKYPVDFSDADTVIDIDTDQSEFCTVMQTELARYRSDIFNDVWSAIVKQ